MPTKLVIALLLGLAVSAAALSQGDPGHKDGVRVKHLFDVETREVASLPGLTAASTAELVTLGGVSLETLKSLRRYQVGLVNEPAHVTVSFLDADYRGRPVRLGVAAGSDGATRALHAFNEFGDVVEPLEPFLAQFRGPTGVGLGESSKRGMGDVLAARDQIMQADKAPKPKDERRAWTLVHHLNRMWRLETTFSELQAARESGDGLRGSLRQLDEQLAGLDDFASNLRAVMKAKGVGAYRARIDELRGLTAEAIELVENDKRDDADKIIKAKMKTSCSRCHGSDDNEWRKPLEKALRLEREDAGFGPGVFAVGVDVRPVELPAEEAQVMASTVKALLLASRSKQ